LALLLVIKPPPPPPPATTKYSTVPEPLGVKVEFPTVVKVWMRYLPDVVIAPPVEDASALTLPLKGVSKFLKVSMYGIKTPMQI
jgi:hypothetical protein